MKIVFIIQISLKFFHRGSINNNQALVEMMAKHFFGAKPLSQPVMA